MDPHRVHVGASHDETSQALQRILQGNDWVLVKGSRGMHMDKIVSELKAWADSPGK